MSFRFAPVLLLVMGCAYRTATVAVPEPLRVTHVAVRGESDLETKEAYERTRRMLKTSNHAEAEASVAVDLGKTGSHIEFMRGDGISLWFMIWPILGGMIIDRERVGVDVVVTSHGRLLRGHGDAEKDGSIYAPAQKRALAVALNRAIKNAYAH